MNQNHGSDVTSAFQCCYYIAMASL